MNNDKEITLYQGEKVDKIVERLSDICVRVSINSKELEVNINDLQSYIPKHVFIDMDGTIADYWDKYGKVGGKLEFYDGFFLDKEPIREVIASIRNNFKNDILYILSASPHEKGVEEKQQWLDKYFNEIPRERRFFIQYPQADKCEVLRYIINERNNLNHEHVVLIDDHHDILKKCEQELLIQVYHPVHIIVMNYDK